MLINWFIARVFHWATKRQICVETIIRLLTAQKASPCGREWSLRASDTNIHLCHMYLFKKRKAPERQRKSQTTRNLSYERHLTALTIKGISVRRRCGHWKTYPRMSKVVPYRPFAAKSRKGSLVLLHYLGVSWNLRLHIISYSECLSIDFQSISEAQVL